MLRRKVSFGILIFLGFAVVTILYLVVMSGTADIHGTVQVTSRLVSGEQNPPGMDETEMLAASGYCIKGADTDNRVLLSTKNKFKHGELTYSFTAKEGMRHMIVVYMQLDHLTGDAGQNVELHFMTNIIKKGDLKRNFAISFKEINGIDSIIITVPGSGADATSVFEYPVSEIPDILEI